MDNILYIPFLNGIKFVDIAPLNIPAYLTKHFDDYLLHEQNDQKEWTTDTPYYQKWQTSDILPLQIESNYDPIQIDLIDADNNIIATEIFANVLSNSQQPGFYVFEAKFSFATIPEGCYFFKLSAGTAIAPATVRPVVMISELQEVKILHQNTVFMQYKNSRFLNDIIFETGIELALRVEATIANLQLGGKKTVYEDETQNPTILQSKPTRTFDFVIGGTYGVPEWLLDKVHRSFGCNSVKLDGKYFAAEGDSAEIKREDNYNLIGATFKVREGLNRYSKIVTTNGNNNTQTLMVAYNIDARLTGSIANSGSDNTVQILDDE